MLNLSNLNLTPEEPSGPMLDRFAAPIPGEALTNAPKSLPFDRPSKYADVEDAIHHIFMGLMNKRSAAIMLSLMEAGMPVSMLVEMIVTSGNQEGLWNAAMVPVLVPPVTAIMLRMAQAAKIQPILTGGDMKPEKTPEIMLKLAEARVSRSQTEAAVKVVPKSGDLKEEHLKVGILSPKGFV